MKIMDTASDAAGRGAMHYPEHWYEFGPMRAPGLLRLALEWRVVWEYSASWLAQPLLANAPEGDGHPVLVFPGLLASDASTRPLRRFLEGRGYAAYGWEQGTNRGPRAGVLDACRERIKEIRKRHKRRLSLIGWSLGGIYAREVAKLHPDLVRQVITLGTPFAGHPRATNAYTLFRLLSGHRAEDPRLIEHLRQPPPVPFTSIYSRSDGVVHWRCSVQRNGERSENIEVSASHFGIGFNPLALYAVADRLAQPEGRWRPFRREGLQGVFFRQPQPE
jgi:pimeloyl-ACP methyl ester carboxylesterase